MANQLLTFDSGAQPWRATGIVSPSDATLRTEMPLCPISPLGEHDDTVALDSSGFSGTERELVFEDLVSYAEYAAQYFNQYHSFFTVKFFAQGGELLSGYNGPTDWNIHLYPGGITAIFKDEGSVRAGADPPDEAVPMPEGDTAMVHSASGTVPLCCMIIRQCFRKSIHDFGNFMAGASNSERQFSRHVLWSIANTVPLQFVLVSDPECETNIPELHSDMDGARAMIQNAAGLVDVPSFQWCDASVVSLICDCMRFGKRVLRVPADLRLNAPQIDVGALASLPTRFRVDGGVVLISVERFTNEVRLPEAPRPAPDVDDSFSGNNELGDDDADPRPPKDWLFDYYNQLRALDPDFFETQTIVSMVRLAQSFFRRKGLPVQRRGTIKKYIKEYIQGPINRKDAMDEIKEFLKSKSNAELAEEDVILEQVQTIVGGWVTSFNIDAAVLRRTVAQYRAGRKRKERRLRKKTVLKTIGTDECIYVLPNWGPACKTAARARDSTKYNARSRVFVPHGPSHAIANTFGYTDFHQMIDIDELPDMHADNSYPKVSCVVYAQRTLQRGEAVVVQDLTDPSLTAGPLEDIEASTVTHLKSLGSTADNDAADMFFNRQINSDMKATSVPAAVVKIGEKSEECIGEVRGSWKMQDETESREKVFHVPSFVMQDPRAERPIGRFFKTFGDEDMVLIANAAVEGTGEDMQLNLTCEQVVADKYLQFATNIVMEAPVDQLAVLHEDRPEVVVVKSGSVVGVLALSHQYNRQEGRWIENRVSPWNTVFETSRVVVFGQKAGDGEFEVLAPQTDLTVRCQLVPEYLRQVSAVGNLCVRSNKNSLIATASAVSTRFEKCGADVYDSILPTTEADSGFVLESQEISDMGLSNEWAIVADGRGALHERYLNTSNGDLQIPQTSEYTQESFTTRVVRNDAFKAVATERELCPRSVTSVDIAIVAQESATQQLSVDQKNAIGVYKRSGDLSQIFVHRLGQSAKTMFVFFFREDVWRLSKLTFSNKGRRFKTFERAVDNSDPDIKLEHLFEVQQPGMPEFISLETDDGSLHFTVTKSSKGNCSSHYDRSLAVAPMQRALDLSSIPFWLGGPRYIKGQPEIRTGNEYKDEFFRTVSVPSSRSLQYTHWQLRCSRVIVDLRSSEDDDPQLICLQMKKEDGVNGKLTYFRASTDKFGSDSADATRVYTAAKQGKGTAYAKVLDSFACDMFGGAPNCLDRMRPPYTPQDLFFRTVDPLRLPKIGIRTQLRNDASLGVAETIGPIAAGDPICQHQFRVIPTAVVANMINRLLNFSSDSFDDGENVFQRAEHVKTMALNGGSDAVGNDGATKLCFHVLKHSGFAPKPFEQGPFRFYKQLRQLVAAQMRNDYLRVDFGLAIKLLQKINDIEQEVIFGTDPETFPYRRGRSGTIFEAYPSFGSLQIPSRTLYCFAMIAMCGVPHFQQRSADRNLNIRRYLRTYETKIWGKNIIPDLTSPSDMALDRFFYYPPPGGHCLLSVPCLDGFGDDAIDEVFETSEYSVTSSGLKLDFGAMLVATGKHPNKRVCKTCMMNDYVPSVPGTLRVNDLQSQIETPQEGIWLKPYHNLESKTQEFLKEHCSITNDSFPFIDFARVPQVPIRILTTQNDPRDENFGERGWMSLSDIEENEGSLYRELEGCPELLESWPPPVTDPRPPVRTATVDSEDGVGEAAKNLVVHYHKSHAPFCPNVVSRTNWREARDLVTKTLYLEPATTGVPLETIWNSSMQL